MKTVDTITKTDKRTFTKVAVRILLILGVINGVVPYLLAAFDKDPVVALGVAWITEVIAVILGYMCKAHFDKNKERENDRLDDIHSKVNWTPEEETSGSIAP